jgi:hypothetical protein
LLAKLTKVFTVDIEGLERCSGLVTVGWALQESMRSMFSRIKNLLKAIMSDIHSYGTQNSGEWTISADRRHLLGIARIIEILATRLEVASVCDNKINNGNQPGMSSSNFREPKDSVEFEVVHSIMGGSPPSIQLSRQEIDKYFPNIQPKTSKRLKFTIGIPGLQNLEALNNNNCNQTASKEEINELYNMFSSAMKQEFA